MEQTRLNEKFINIMEQLANIMLKQGQPFKARAYQKAQETIASYHKNIKDPNDLINQPNIGSTIMEKLNEYIKTGTLEIIEREKINPVNILTDVYGIGPKKAKELVDQGIKNIKELRDNQHLLNEVQKVGLKYYEDVLKRIPRQEIDEYKVIIYQLLEKVDQNLAPPFLKVEVVGSYRRGAETSGDIDIIITSESPKSFIKLIDELIKQGIIVNVLSRGSSKCLVMAKIPSSQTIRRVDFLYTTLEEYPFAILYFTGSKTFNTIMRQKAQDMGYTMNEHGITSLLTKEKVNSVRFETEKDIFDFLKMEYKTPEERNPPFPPFPPFPPLEKVEPNLLEKVEPNLLEKVEPNLLEKVDLKVDLKVNLKVDVNEELLSNAPNVPKAPRVTKKKTLKNKLNKDIEKKNKKIIILENTLLKKVEQKNKPNLELDCKEDLAPFFLKVDSFKKNGISFLDSLNEEDLISLLTFANEMYCNSDPIMTDNEYDILENYIKEKYPKNQIQIGAPVTKNKVKLPYFMGSMNKIKPDTNELNVWKSKFKSPQYLLSCKLDGVSGLYTTEGSKPKLYTRGDGTYGQDVSHLIPYLNLPKTPNVVIRGEFIISKAIFETKYKDQFANPRNMVAGLINQKSTKTTNTETLKDITFIAYELIKPEAKPSYQLHILDTKLKVNVVHYFITNENSLTNELLSKTLISYRKDYPYEMDGIIVTDDSTIYPHNTEGNPEHSFAFKMVLTEQIAEAKVVDVIWTPSKDGYLKPRVQIEPIQLGGVQIEYATGFNAKFIQDHKIGVGSLIELVRSGDVIPHIRKVITPATEPKMPSQTTSSYKWSPNHVDIILEDIQSNEDVIEKNITGFFKGIQVDGLSSGNISRIIQHTSFNTIPKILNMTTTDFLKVEGFKEKTATKLYEGIKSKIQEASLLTMMSASNIFGRGFNNKKIELILKEYPDILLSTDSLEIKIQKVEKIKGMAKKTAEAFVNQIPAFLEFLSSTKLEYKLTNQNEEKNQNQTTIQINTENPLYNKTIVFTGFRDEELQDQLKNLGVKQTTSISKNTFILLVKDKQDETNKVIDAKKLNIPIMTKEEFKIKYYL